MNIRFLGTGAADWHEPDDAGEYRRWTSTLFDGKLLIDGTPRILDMLGDCEPIDDVLLTHSHGDHYSVEALQAIRPKRVFAHESWADEIRLSGIEVRPVRIGERFEAAGFGILPLPANHATSRTHEQPLHYVLVKDGKSVFYATDGAWLTSAEFQLLRGHRVVLDAIIVDATIGDGHEGDDRIFEHNSLPMIRMMAETLHAAGILKPDAPICLTHLARTLHGSQAELERANPAPYVVCKDGLTLDIG